MEKEENRWMYNSSRLGQCCKNVSRWSLRRFSFSVSIQYFAPDKYNVFSRLCLSAIFLLKKGQILSSTKMFKLGKK
jgi:hypothetical protein